MQSIQFSIYAGLVRIKLHTFYQIVEILFVRKLSLPVLRRRIFERRVCFLLIIIRHFNMQFIPDGF